MRKVLVVYDGTAQAAKALEKAIDMTTKDDAIILLHVVPAPKNEELSIIPPEVSIAESQRTISEVTTKLNRDGWNAIGVVRVGEIVEEILKIGSEMKCDLIVIGDRGVSKIDRFAVAKIADIVAKRSPRPVLVVR